MPDFIAENIDRFSSLEYGNMHGNYSSTKVGKLRVKLVTGSAEKHAGYATCFAIVFYHTTSLSYGRKHGFYSR